MPDWCSRGPRVAQRRIPLTIVLAVIATATLLAGAQSTSTSTPAPVETREQIRDFLATAKIVRGKDTNKGVTRPVRVTLSDGTFTHDALFSTVDEQKAVERFESGRMELDFVDSYKYNLAAYNLAVLVGLDDMMPVHVEREWRGRKGALVWWVDNVRMDEAERLKKKVKPPSPEAWNRQMHRMRVFAQLVADTDRNAGNALIDQDWKLWMIDFTRAFRHTKTLLNPAELKRCDRRLLDALRGLTAAQIGTATKPYLQDAEIEPILARRDQIVAIFDKLVAENGEAQVLY
jgi:hypothetical protein